MTAKNEKIRAIKSMQTVAVVQREALYALRIRDSVSGGIASDLAKELKDSEVTAQNHIDALQHVIDELAKEPSDG